MLYSIFARRKIDYSPVIIRITAAIVIVAYIFDFFRRKSAVMILAALKEAGAVDADSAVSLEKLRETSPGAVRFAFLFLREGSSLRRVVEAVKPEAKKNADEDEASSEDGKKKKKKPIREDINALRFYLPERGEDSRSLPASMRDGGEQSVLRLVIAIVLAVIAAEIVVYFFPQIKDLITSPGEMFS